VNLLDLLHVELKGRHLIEASAGTGKTYTIASLYVRLLLQEKIPVSRILVVTYTVPATAELKTRIREKLRLAYEAFRTGVSDDLFLAGLAAHVPDRMWAMKTLSEALSRFDEAAISTIHGFCQRMLKELAFETGSPFTTELITDQAALLLSAADDFYRTHVVQETVPELVAYARIKKVTPEMFVELAGRSNLAARVIPDLSKPVLEPHLTAYRKAFAAMCSQWPTCREEVNALLCCTDILSQTTYRLSKIPSFLEEMDCYLKSGGIFLPLSKEVCKFTRASIENGTKKDKTPPEHAFFGVCENLAAAADALTGCMDQYLTWLKVAFHGFIRRYLPEKKARLGIVHYDDLLLRMHEALSSGSAKRLAHAVGERFHAALIDEFQDTDPLQYDIFRLCFTKGPLFFIGDPKQAVYSFRGADIFTYRKAAQSVDRDHQSTLIHNWRSAPELIEAVNDVFSPAEDPFVYEWIGFEEARPAPRTDRKTITGLAGGPLAVWYMDAGDNGELTGERASAMVCRAVSGEISRLLFRSGQGEVMLGERGLRPSDMAVLVRTNAQARAVRDALRACSIPCVLYSDENVFLSHEAFEIDVLLAALAEPSREGLVRTALMTRIFSLAPSDVEKLLEDEPAWEQWIVTFRDYHDLWERSGFTPMFRRLLDARNVRPRLLAGKGGERALTNVLHLAELLGRAEVQEKLGMHGLIKWLTERRDPEMPVEEEYQLRLESDDDAVKVMTVHKSKGLEFPIVFCPFVWNPVGLRKDNSLLFHDDDSSAVLDLGSGDEGHRAKAVKEALAENVRLLYVALTRARNRCYAAWGRVKDVQTSALGYLVKSAEGKGTGGPVAARKDSGSETRSALEDYLGRDRVRDIPQDMPEPPAEAPNPAEEVEASAFRTDIDRSWGIASYTSLISGIHRVDDGIDRDSLPAGDLSEEEPSPEGSGIFSLPKGARTGILLHAVFEEIDFQADDAAIQTAARDATRKYGFDAFWLDAVVRMVKNTLQADLGGFSLQDVPGNDRLSELEFFFPISTLAPKSLGKALVELSPAEGRGQRTPKFIFDPVHGFIRGFMDLVFKHGGQYYLVDWKSNHLGDSIKDYHEAALAKAMEKNHYILQYHLYTVALHRYLGRSLKSYSYEKHFGGIFYVFLRGIDPEKGQEYGIFRARPEEEAIERMSRMF
jgi:exodeoxyribonuclease V beta subunit